MGMTKFKRKLAAGLAMMLAARAISAQSAALAPPMGWNSWDAYGLTITESQFRANVKVLKDKLLPYGWRYAVIDEGWFFENPQERDKPDTLHYAIDSHGRYVPVPDRFPSSRQPGKADPARVQAEDVRHPPKLAVTIEETSFAPLAAWVHEQGLFFGIHIVRGIPRASVERNLPIEGSSFTAHDAADTNDACTWDPTNWGVTDNAAGQAWYDSLLRQYAAWGVDLLKVDCIADRPYKVDEIRMIRRAIDKVGRPMVLSLSPGPTALEHAQEISSLGNMWRISNDIWDVWANDKPADFPQDIRGQFERATAWVPFDFPPGRYPDLDMLPLGELKPAPGWGVPRTSRLTPDEQKTLLTLWAIKQSPLILGANLTMLDDATLKLLTNKEWIALDQMPGSVGRPVQPNEKSVPLAARYKDLRIWNVSSQEDDAHLHHGLYAALFNLGDTPLTVDSPVHDLNLSRTNRPSRPVELYDVWAGKPLGALSRVKATIAPHGCVLLERR
jgi:alpha-galactosidase